MIRTLTIICVTLLAQISLGQEDTLVYSNPDSAAEFEYENCENSIECIRNYVKSNAIWPSRDDIQLTVYVQCRVEKNGSLTQLKIVKGDNGIFDQASLELVQKMPNWIPAQNEGKVVRSIIYIPVRWE